MGRFFATMPTASATSSAVSAPSFWGKITRSLASRGSYYQGTEPRNGGNTEARGIAIGNSNQVNSSSPFSAWQSLLNSWGIGDVILNEDTAQGIPAFARAIDVISSQIASLPISIFRKSQDGKREEAKDHQLYPLLKYRPHPLYNSSDFRSAIIRLLMLRGDCGVWMPPRRRGLTELRIMGKLTEIREVGGKYYYRFDGHDGLIVSDQILHFKLHTKTGITGQNPMYFFKETFERAIAEIQFGNAYYKGGGQVGSLLVPDQAMSPKQFEQAMAAWGQNNTGKDKIGKVGIMPLGFKLLKLGDNISDNKLNESRERTTEDFSNITAVNPVLLGSMNKATFGNVEELNRIFVQFTLRAFIKIIEDEFNTKAIALRERETTYVRFNTSGLLRGDTKTRAAFYLAMRNTQSISPNEIRNLENMDPYDGGEEYNLPLASNIKTEPEKPPTDEPD